MKTATLYFCLLLAGSLSALPPQSDSRGSDGHFHDPDTGAVQPDQCDNSFKNKTPCTCEKTEDKCDGVAANPGAKCKTYAGFTIVTASTVALPKVCTRLTFFRARERAMKRIADFGVIPDVAWHVRDARDLEASGSC